MTIKEACRCRLLVIVTKPVHGHNLICNCIHITCGAGDSGHRSHQHSVSYMTASLLLRRRTDICASLLGGRHVPDLRHRQTVDQSQAGFQLRVGRLDSEICHPSLCFEPSSRGGRRAKVMASIVASTVFATLLSKHRYNLCVRSSEKVTCLPTLLTSMISAMARGLQPIEVCWTAAVVSKVF